MPAAVRLGDICSGHEAWPPRPNDTASSTVFVNIVGLHRVGDHWVPHTGNRSTHDGVQATGSETVFCENKKIARVGDSISCGSVNAQGSPNVFVGDVPYQKKNDGYSGPEWGADMGLQASLEPENILPPSKYGFGNGNTKVTGLYNQPTTGALF